MLRRLARLYGRQIETASLAVTLEWPVRAAIASTQRHPRFGPFVTPQTFELADSAGGLPRRHAASTPTGRTCSSCSRSTLAGRRVLDLGCGYGGRTVFYAEQGATMAGIEISDVMVERCRAFAAEHGVAVDFRLGRAEALEFPAASFDAVLSYDVLEHVQDPAQALREIARVLVPGGTAWLVFPTYLGGLASHLDYVTQLPFLHRVFDPDTLIAAVNHFLADPNYGVPSQPASRVGPLGRRTLPTLNGMSLRDVRALLADAGLEIEWWRARPLLTGRAPLLARVLERRARLPEALVSQLAFKVRR